MEKATVENPSRQSATGPGAKTDPGTGRVTMTTGTVVGTTITRKMAKEVPTVTTGAIPKAMTGKATKGIVGEKAMAKINEFKE
jgi:hypothetical protein